MGVSMECSNYYEYRCNGRYYQKRLVTVYGTRCQNRRYGTWQNVVLGCPGSGD